MRHISPRDVHAILRKHMLVDGFDIVVDLEKSKGSYLVDAITGKKYLDFFTYFATLPLGHNHPGLLTPDFKKRLLRAAINKPSNSDFYTVEMAEFVETFSRYAIPDYLPHLFLIDGGALAVENALKTAFDWKVRKNFEKGYTVEKGTKVIHFREAFHGRSGYTLSLTNTSDPRKYMYFPKFDWPRVLNPKITFPLNEENLARVKEAEEISLRQIQQAIARDPDDIAALIIEPIQGEGGDNHFRPEFLRELRRICDENEILLIFDEVQTGVGLTGKMWAHQHFDVRPDIMAFGKKTQVCGILAGPRIDEVKNNVFQESSRLNSTWGGNLVDMVRFARILEIIHEENLIENAARVGEYLLRGLEEIAHETDGQMSNVRGRGLFIAFDLPTTELRNKFLRKALENRLIALASGERSVRFRPPLNLKPEEADHGLEIVRKTLRAILPKKAPAVEPGINHAKYEL
ncbi:MAG: L-lysine 6-transaminase [candidate division KSB1 bacterium]|nr:L-lysine 6-transaminase [candidate division KSB1 bacterium]